MGEDNNKEGRETLTKEGRETLAKEDGESKEDKELLEGYSLVFLILLLDYYLKDNKYRSILISAAVVLGVDSNCR